MKFDFLILRKIVRYFILNNVLYSLPPLSIYNIYILSHKKKIFVINIFAFTQAVTPSIVAVKKLINNDGLICRDQIFYVDESILPTVYF
jgi:hypothetical protein